MTGELNIWYRDDEVSEAETRENGHVRRLRASLSGNEKGVDSGFPGLTFIHNTIVYVCGLS